MIKHTNPFITFDEAVAVLKSLGAKPTANPFKYNEDTVHWPDHILSMSARRVYNDTYEYYFEIDIHMDAEGLRALADLTGLTISRGHHSGEYDALVLRPSNLITVTALEAMPTTQVEEVKQS